MVYRGGPFIMVSFKELISWNIGSIGFNLQKLEQAEKSADYAAMINSIDAAHCDLVTLRERLRIKIIYDEDEKDGIKQRAEEDKQ